MDDDAVESRIRHAHDRHGMAVDGHRLVENAGIVGEVTRPIAVADNDYRVSTRCVIVFWHQHAADRGADAECAEEVARHQLGRSRLGIAAPTHRWLRTHSSDHGREGCVPVAEVAVHRIGEDRLGVVAGTRPGTGVVRVEQHQPFRIFHRQRPQHHLIQQRENRRVGSDSQCEGEYGGRGEQRTPPQNAKRVGEFPNHGQHSPGTSGSSLSI